MPMEQRRSARSASNRPESLLKDACYWSNLNKDKPSLLKLYMSDIIGYGVFTKEDICKGDFVVEYKGELITEVEGYKREKEYDIQNSGSYLYFFKNGSKALCIDATHSSFLGKFVNDSSVAANCAMKVVEIDGTPHLCLHAKRNISKGTEIRYNYGVSKLWWRGKKELKTPWNMSMLSQKQVCKIENQVEEVLQNLVNVVVEQDNFDKICEIENQVLEVVQNLVNVVVEQNNNDKMNILGMVKHFGEDNEINFEIEASDNQISVRDLNFSDSDIESIHEKSITDDSGLLLESDQSVYNSDISEVFEAIALPDSIPNQSTPRNDRSKQKSIKNQKKKANHHPNRTCFICGKVFSRLTRHITKSHKDDDVVKNALLMPKKEKVKCFRNFKKMGIHQENMKEINARSPKFQREKKVRKCKDLVMCSLCNGFYAKSFITRHMKDCGNDSCSSKVGVPLPLLGQEFEKLKAQFKEDILSRMRNDPIGITAKSDEIILMIGSRLYEKVKRRQDKKHEIQNTVRTDMRRLSHLYTHFQSKNVNAFHGNASDMFIRTNFDALKDAIELYTDSNAEQQKAGLKAALYYLISGSAKKCVGHFLAQDKDDVAKQFSDFLVLLALRKDEVFADATYDLNLRRNVKSKKPAQLPIEQDIKIIREHIVSTVKRFEEDPFIIWDSHTFIKLRDCTCTRLTLFNGRRGGEPARLLLREWQEAEEGTWLDRQRFDVVDNDGDLKITYQTGKGVNHLVPVLIPKDIFFAMRTLADKEIRRNVGISETNPYLFPSTQNSERHFSGWHSLTNVCEYLPIKDKSRITGTTNRHRLSTLMAAIDLTDAERELVYKHFGHSRDMNENVYQAPAAHQQLSSTGKHLLNIDTGSLDVREKTKDKKTDLPVASLSVTEKAAMVHSGPTIVSMNIPRLRRGRKAQSCESRSGSEVAKDVIFTDNSKNVKITSSVETTVTDGNYAHKNDNESCKGTAAIPGRGNTKFRLRKRKKKQSYAGLCDYSSGEDVMKGTSKNIKLTAYYTNDESSSDESSSGGCDDESCGNAEISGKKYHQWTNEDIKFLLDEMGTYIRDKNKGWPSASDMKATATRLGISVYTLRTKINNERVKLDREVKKRMKDMKMSSFKTRHSPRKKAI
ncbi:uncharacterized protein LOC130612732 isoform X2 [Hydractinia symbiolongicarpus]|nr:uncharacterized protein LOC130612732 isoform X2 [Hydractinia symbiolongicarpus]XP_057290066.1 uncharacterized protein LOC130612732 isoform X2 [Hydractinia symbiolongicarpus]